MSKEILQNTILEQSKQLSEYWKEIEKLRKENEELRGKEINLEKLKPIMEEYEIPLSKVIKLLTKKG